MHLLAEQTTVVACTVAAAYQYASNLERFGEWFPGVVAIESGNGLSHATLGKEYVETVAIPFRGTRKAKLIVTEAEQDKLLVTEGELAPLMPRMEIAFQGCGAASCQVTWKMFSRNDGSFARIALAPLARYVMRKRAAIGVARLKEKLEESDLTRRSSDGLIAAVHQVMPAKRNPL